MSDKAVWMRDEGLGDVPPKNEKAHCRLWGSGGCIPYVDCKVSRDSQSQEVELPYIASTYHGVREGIPNTPEQLRGTDPVLCQALSNFFGGDCWERCTSESWHPGAIYRVLVCEPKLAHKTVLARNYTRQDSEGEYVYNTLKVWGGERSRQKA